MIDMTTPLMSRRYRSRDRVPFHHHCRTHRQHCGDWGDLDAEDKQANENSLNDGSRILRRGHSASRIAAIHMSSPCMGVGALSGGVGLPESIERGNAVAINGSPHSGGGACLLCCEIAWDGFTDGALTKNTRYCDTSSASRMDLLVFCVSDWTAVDELDGFSLLFCGLTCVRVCVF